MPIAIWIYMRLLVPTGPILIQYALHGLGLYSPPFPQHTYTLLVFTLSLVTVTEYENTTWMLYASVTPAIGASILYTVYLLTIDKPDTHRLALLVGFYLWLILVAINLLRVIFDSVKRTLDRRPTR